MPKSKYTHIIWDWNGTLKNDAEICVEITNDLLLARDKTPITMETYQEYFDFPVKDYYQKVGLDFTLESFESLANEFMDNYGERSTKCDLHPNAALILKEFTEQGIAQHVLSARQQAPLEKSLETYGLRKYFERVVGLSDHYANSKVDNGKKLVTEMAAPAEQIILIGDTTHDFEVAQAIGVNCVLFAGGHQSKARLKACGAPVIEDLNELLNIIQ